MSDTTDAVALDFPDQPSLVFIGPPGQLRGELHLRNSGARKVIVRDPRVCSRAAPILKLAGEKQEATWSLRRVVLRPGQARRVPVSLELDFRTPPGEYEVEIDILGQRQPFRVHVTENVELSISPEDVVVENRPGATVVKSIVLANRGNVPIAVPEIGSIGIDDELAHCRAARGALAEVGDKITKLDDFLAALGRQYKAIYDPLVLRIHNEKVTLSPGEVRSLDLKIGIPKGLLPRARYVAVAPLSTSSLQFTIVPS